MLTILLTALFALLIVLAARVFLHHGITLPPTGSTAIDDRDAQRIDLELRAITGMREHG
ncbi:hypothetical protein BJY24_006995 [Nocardia transvalensis]|uniref:Uncharacterized protein n=1 Tax=Nocardia transvalensis TaxID=37333 RepID=A0A7W9PM97_9NOCA|nr:hypothetical protein [Nocardia transvalensis]MBB5918083.1 hypothetical protein [Nocardia transvalensis]